VGVRGLPQLLLLLRLVCLAVACLLLLLMWRALPEGQCLLLLLVVLC
jgi:hypothetical protein